MAVVEVLRSSMQDPRATIHKCRFTFRLYHVDRMMDHRGYTQTTPSCRNSTPGLNGSRQSHKLKRRERLPVLYQLSPLTRVLYSHPH